MKASSMTPVKVRLLLTVMMFLVLVIQGVIVFFGFHLLDTASPDINAAIAKSQSSEVTLSSLKKAEKELEANKGIIPKVEGLAIKESQIEPEIINGLNQYAAKTGVTITGFTFSPSAGGAKAATPTAAPAASSSPGATAGAKSATTAQISGLTPSTITVTLGSSASYDDIIRFIRVTESSIPFLQIQDLTIARPSSSQSGQSSSGLQNLTFQVYTRK